MTVKDICNEAKLTERYFYESFQKSEQLFQSIFLKQIEILQSTMMQAIVQASPNPRKMVTAGLSALFNLLKNDPRLARIIYIDATLVQELHKQAIIRETMNKFDRMIQAFVMSLMPQIPQAEQEISLVATGLNGYVTQVARRWVIGEFKQSQDEIVAACELVFIALIEKFIP